MRVGQEIVDGRLHPLLLEKAQRPLHGACLAEDFFEADMVPSPIFHGTGRGIDDYQTLVVDPGGDTAAFPGGNSEETPDRSEGFLGPAPALPPGARSRFFPTKHASSLHRGADGPIEGTGKTDFGAQKKSQERKQDYKWNNPGSGSFYRSPRTQIFSQGPRLFNSSTRLRMTLNPLSQKSGRLISSPRRARSSSGEADAPAFQEPDKGRDEGFPFFQVLFIEG